jgi:hypothetical protein
MNKLMLNLGMEEEISTNQSEHFTAKFEFGLEKKPIKNEIKVIY